MSEREAFTSIGVPISVRNELKILAANSGERMYELVANLVKREKGRIERMQYVPQTGPRGG